MAQQNEIEHLYPYTPSLVAAVVAAVVFLCLFIIHLARLFARRTWFCVPFSVGAIFEIIGYLARAQSSRTPEAEGPYLIQAIFILIAPIFLAAPIYTFLERIICSTKNEHHSFIRPQLLTVIFVAGDIVCFFLQLVGAAIMGEAKTRAKLDFANDFVFAGLAAQICIFLLFMAVGVVFHRRVRNVQADLSFEPHLHWLYGVCAIIMVRNIIRIVQCGLGEDNYLSKAEWPGYVFDAVPMVLVLLVCNWWYVNLTGKVDEEKDDLELLTSGSQTTLQPSCKGQMSTTTLDIDLFEGDKRW